MLPVSMNLIGPATAENLPANYLYKTRGSHIQQCCLKVFTFLKSRGLNREQTQNVTEALGKVLREKLDIKILLANDEIASKVMVTPDCRFIFPPEAKQSLIREGLTFIRANPILANWFGETLTSDSPRLLCPSALFTGICTHQV